MQSRKRRPWVAIWALALGACSTACASTGATPKPFPVPGGPSAPASPARPAPSAPESAVPEAPAFPGAPPPPALPAAPRAPYDGYALTGTALALRGIPYRDGGTDISGFDCSGFTQYVFGQHGVRLPREVRDQYRTGKPVEPEDLSPGDILFFTTTAPGPTHVAIAIGADEFVHAPSSTGVVRVERLSSSYWSPRFLGARRVN